MADNESESKLELDPMVALTKTLASSDFEVSRSSPNDPNRPHPRFSSYKNRGQSISRQSDQDGRRKRLLEHQKNRRTDSMNVARALIIGDLEDESDDEDDGIEESMDTNYSQEYFYKRCRVRKSYKKQLMLSEWLVQVPDDLYTTWQMVPVPVGKRALIVAGEGRTKHFSRGGAFINQFPSLLPGGCRKQPSWKQSQALVDAIYVEATRTYYVLDIMVWNDLALYDCDTTFRFYWLNRKLLEENPQCLERSKVNPYIFKPLKYYPTDRELLQNVLMEPDFPNFDGPLDGLLFYHNMLNYMPGHTPLVGWLKGYMVPEMLGLSVSSALEAQKPAIYSSMKDHITEFETNYFKEKENRKNNRACEKNVNDKEFERASSVKEQENRQYVDCKFAGDDMES